MERGMGWEYPPGTSGESYPARYKCRECGEESEVKVVRELGTGWTEPEDCPKCGGEFDPDSEEEFDPREEAAEAEFDRMREEGEL